MTELEQRAAALDAAARATPSVRDVYAAAPDVLSRIRSVVAGDAPATLSHVGDGDPVHVIVTAGVDSHRPVAETAGEIADRARALEPDAEILVRVSRIRV